MVIFFSYIGIVLLSLLLLTICFFFVSTLYVHIKSKGGPNVPFIPLPKEAILSLAHIVKIQDGDIVYDLGCGDGRVITKIYDVSRKGRYVGVERNTFVFYLATLRAKFFSLRTRLSSIKIVCGDIFDQNIHEATHVVVFLFPEVLNALLPKLESELQRGVLLYSVDFQFDKKAPKEIVTLHTKKYVLGQKVYVYEF